MATTKQLYAAIDATWPEGELPIPTDWEVVRAASRLYRWARGTACPHEIKATSGNRRTWIRGGVLYVNPNCRDDHGGGWRSFIHDLSHALDLEPEGHSKHHARLERRMVAEVIKRGWLDGRLRREEKAPKVDDKRAAELARIEAAMQRWESKRRRAENALKKLAKRQRYYSRAVEARA